VKYSYNPRVKEHHLKRVQMYMALCGAGRGILIYISPRGIISYETTQALSSKEIVFHATAWSSPKWTWECDYCEFSEFCSIRALASRERKEVG
jgi:CRISPR-associated exonuclease Cas4